MFNKNLTLRLATAVINRSNLMSEAIITKGHIFHFKFSDIKKDFDKGSRANVLKVLDVATIKLDNN